MKRILVLTLVGVGILLAGLYISTDTIVEKSEPEIIERETVVSELEKRVSEAQNANLSDVQAKADSAYEEAYNQAMKEIELEVTKLYREEIEAKETELEKDVGIH
jgi:predicted outer membrane protein